MGTDLFGKYFSNPTKSYIYTNLLCNNGLSGDEYSFDIVNSDGVISDNTSTLASIDLSDVHVGLTEYTNDMKIIDPHSFIYVKGISRGLSYCKKYFGIVSLKVLEDEEWMYKTTLIFHIKYVDKHGNKVAKCIKASGSLDSEYFKDCTFIEKCQELFDENGINIVISYEDRYITFTGGELGYDFWIPMLELWHYTGEGDIQNVFPELFGDQDSEHTNELGFGFDDEWSNSTSGKNTVTLGSGNAYTTVISESQYRYLYDSLGANAVSDDDSDYDIIDVSTNDLFSFYLFEDLTKYIPAMKYRNGAMKGVIINATYPIYNAETIKDVQRALKIGFLKDRVEDFYTTKDNEYTGLPLYVRVVRDVVDAYHSQYEYDLYKKWSNSYTHINYHDNWIDPEEIPYYDNLHSEWNHSHVPNMYMMNSLYKDIAHYDAIGLFGYATYLTNHNGWETFGQLYARTTVNDDESTDTYNLIPSFLIYNPNDFPVTVKYMTFV